MDLYIGISEGISTLVAEVLVSSALFSLVFVSREELEHSLEYSYNHIEYWTDNQTF